MRLEEIKDWTEDNAKAIADALTLGRFVCVFLILACALTTSKYLLPWVIALILVGWTTDILDGRMARLDKSGAHSWVGDHDFAVDMALIYSGLVYLVAAGFLPFWPFFAYGIYALLSALVWTKKSVMMAMAAPMAAAPIVVAFVHRPAWGWIFLGWIALALSLNWRRFTGVVGGFISDMEDRHGEEDGFSH
ncbi:MAG: CDP-alcohol phosphatidyltransferase family protein [Candidatus Geothermincolales bacterium]